MNNLNQAFNILCSRLGRNPIDAEESDTCSLRAAAKAMVAFAEIHKVSDIEPKERALCMIRDLVTELETWDLELLEVLQCTPQAALMREWLRKTRIDA